MPARQSILEVDSLTALQRASRQRHEAEVALLHSNARTRVLSLASLDVARHSGASSCTVSLVRWEGMLQLTIGDDGRGIDTAAARASDARRRLGLIGMRERAQALAGTFVIANRVEGGTRVTVRLPGLRAPAAAEAPAAHPLAG